MATYEYQPDDFSQLAINRGQRKINSRLNDVDKNLIQALRALRDLVATLTPPANQQILAASSAIEKADEISKVVADIRPPGCDTT